MRPTSATANANLSAWLTTIKNLQVKFLKVKYLIQTHQNWTSIKSFRTHTASSGEECANEE
jgi:hypothetical protein